MSSSPSALTAMVRPGQASIPLVPQPALRPVLAGCDCAGYACSCLAHSSAAILFSSIPAQSAATGLPTRCPSTSAGRHKHAAGRAGAHHGALDRPRVGGCRGGHDARRSHARGCGRPGHRAGHRVAKAEVCRVGVRAGGACSSRVQGSGFRLLQRLSRPCCVISWLSQTQPSCPCHWSCAWLSHDTAEP